MYLFCFMIVCDTISKTKNHRCEIMQELKLRDGLLLKTKVAVMGSDRVGKTSLLGRLAYDKFDSRYEPTIGVEFSFKTLDADRDHCRLEIWDTSGQERFRSLVPSYLRDSQIIILVFSVENQKSFDEVKVFLNMAREERSAQATYLLLGNKTDCPDRVITQEEAQDYAEQEDLTYIETSAKTPGNCMEAIKQVVIKHAVPDQIPEAPRASPRLSVERRYALSDSITVFENTRPDNKEIKAIAGILMGGLDSQCDPKNYFEEQFETLKGHLNTLQMTSKSLANSALNIIVTVFLAVTVVGLPLAYWLGLLQKNEEASGHKFMFFAFGAKQAAQIASRDVFKATQNENLKFSRSY